MIGEGGMGKVYKAIQIALDKPVVLKVLRQALLSDERTVKRFQREAKAASRLNHPNSISVLDFGQADDGAMYIAMEYVQGKDLHHILSREWPLPEARVIRLMSQVLSALADAHSAGVIHRDLKPENIMVEQRRGEADFVKVLDFGIAKIVDGSIDEDGPALTRAGFVCGTPEYMSPEQARGAQLDHRSDLYAVGVIIYQLMCGMLPFDSDSAVGFATKHLTEIPPPPTKRRPDARVSQAMERLIMKALAKNPDDRPQTAEQFRAELMAIEKERRASVGTQNRRAASSAPGLAPVPRKVTPIDQQETRVNPPQSPWASNETTVKASSPIAGPVPAENTSPTTSPDRDTTPGAGASSIIFKVATVLLVTLALALAGIYGWSVMQNPKVYVPPPNAPLTGSGQLYEYDPPHELRRPGDATRDALEGDSAWHKGNISVALTAYLSAWRADPQPELALKIGELYLQQDMKDEARAWWARYRKDAPDTKALSYIDQMLEK
ncbi:MAG: serine/threonine-protein kinase [Archangium sp.]|nr:serine/threonine-protein kinase [Archangium sp.]